MRTRLMIVLVGLSLGTSAWAGGKTLTAAQISKLIPCAAPLISHWIQEKGAAKKVTVTYGNHSFSRTDVGEPDGDFEIAKQGKTVCKIGLSLVPDIYFSKQGGIIIFKRYNGSEGWYEFYSATDCSALGQSGNAGTETFKLTTQLLDENQGRMCQAAAD